MKRPYSLNVAVVSIKIFIFPLKFLEFQNFVIWPRMIPIKTTVFWLQKFFSGVSHSLNVFPEMLLLWSFARNCLTSLRNSFHFSKLFCGSVVQTQKSYEYRLKWNCLKLFRKCFFVFLYSEKSHQLTNREKFVLSGCYSYDIVKKLCCLREYLCLIKTLKIIEQKLIL